MVSQVRTQFRSFILSIESQLVDGTGYIVLTGSTTLTTPSPLLPTFFYQFFNKTEIILEVSFLKLVKLHTLALTVRSIETYLFLK